MDKSKSITFDKEAQDNLPQHIKDKMKAQREELKKSKANKNNNFSNGEIEYKIGQEIEFNIYGNIVKGLFKSIDNKNVISITTTYDSLGISKEDGITTIHKDFLTN